MKLTATQTAALKEVASRHGLFLVVTGTQIAIGARGEMAKRVVYSANARPGYRWQLQTKARDAGLMAEMIEALAA